MVANRAGVIRNVTLCQMFQLGVTIFKNHLTLCQIKCILYNVRGNYATRQTNGENMKNKLNDVFDKNIVCVRTLCIKDGRFLDSTEWDSFFDYRVEDIKNCTNEVLAYLEWKEKFLNDSGKGKFEIILLDIYINYKKVEVVR